MMSPILTVWEVWENLPIKLQTYFDVFQVKNFVMIC